MQWFQFLFVIPFSFHVFMKRFVIWEGEEEAKPKKDKCLNHCLKVVLARIYFTCLFFYLLFIVHDAEKLASRMNQWGRHDRDHTYDA